VGSGVSECIPWQPETCIEAAIADGLSAMAKSFADSAGWCVKHLMTLWLAVPSPDVTGGVASWLSDRLTLFVFASAFASVLYAAYGMATSGQFHHAADLAYSLGKLVVVAGVAATATSLALAIGDAVALWVLGDAPAQLSRAVILPLATTPPGLTLLLALVVIITQVVQVGLMMVKSAMVVLLVGFLPLTAAATNTPLGKNGYQRALTWLLAFVLYKPVAAIIYAVAFRLSSREQTMASQMYGIALMILAIAALPALMRFLAPATAAATGGNAGAVSGAVVGATLATGAVVATGGVAGGGFAAMAGPAASAAPTGAALGGGGGGAPAGAVAPPPSDDPSPAPASPKGTP
jgi:type IV secretion system protein TrbL